MHDSLPARLHTVPGVTCALFGILQGRYHPARELLRQKSAQLKQHPCNMLTTNSKVLSKHVSLASLCKNLPQLDYQQA